MPRYIHTFQSVHTEWRLSCRSRQVWVPCGIQLYWFSSMFSRKCPWSQSSPASSTLKHPFLRKQLWPTQPFQAQCLHLSPPKTPGESASQRSDASWARSKWRLQEPLCKLQSLQVTRDYLGLSVSFRCCLNLKSLHDLQLLWCIFHELQKRNMFTLRPGMTEMSHVKKKKCLPSLLSIFIRGG